MGNLRKIKMKTERNFYKIKPFLSFLIMLLVNNVTNLHFDFSKDEQKCIIEEFFLDTIAIIKWKIFASKEASDIHLSSLANSFKVYVFRDSTNEILKEYMVHKLTEKI